MTPFGKLLVYLNAFIALILFGWAMSLYTNRANWFDTTVEGGPTVPGQFTVLGKEIASLNAEIQAQQTAYTREAAECSSRERKRDARQIVQRVSLLGLKLGDPKAVFRNLSFYKDDGSAELVAIQGTDVQGDVLNGGDGKPLRSHGALRDEFAKLFDQTMTAQLELIKFRDAYKQTCDEIDVVQAELFRQRDILNNLGDEKGLLDDARIIWQEQLRVLEVRKSQLLVRIESLTSPRTGGR